jgi:putative endonuclease
MSNNSMTLYTGVTSNLVGRINQHKGGAGSGLPSRYHFDRVVYVETYDLVLEAIAREKSIKALSRAKKVALVKSLNPTWTDLLPPSS